MIDCHRCEELLLDSATRDAAAESFLRAHLAICTGCAGLAQDLRQLDEAFTAEFAPACVSPEFRDRLNTRLANEAVCLKPSWVPEALDAIGWAAILAIAAVLSWPLLPLIH